MAILKPQQVAGGLDPVPPKPGAVAMMLAPLGLLVACAALAVLLARRDRQHRPVAIALWIMAGAALVRLALDAPLSVAGPHVGWTRALFHIDQALLLAGVFALPWVACVTLWDRFRRYPWPSMWIFGWLVSVAMVALDYPTLRGDALRRVYLAAELGTLFVCALAIVLWLRRLGSLSRAQVAGGLDPVPPKPGVVADDTTFPPGPGTSPRWYTIATVLVLVLGDAALLGLGAWQHGLFGNAYMLQQAGLLAVYFVIVCVHVAALVSGRKAT